MVRAVTKKLAELDLRRNGLVELLAEWEAALQAAKDAPAAEEAAAVLDPDLDQSPHQWGPEVAEWDRKL